MKDGIITISEERFSKLILCEKYVECVINTCHAIKSVVSGENFYNYNVCEEVLRGLFREECETAESVAKEGAEE